jgi:hypothetical protein
MAAENNPFYVAPVNPLAALLQFDSGYKGMREMRQNRALDDVGEALSSGNYEDAAKAAFRAGKLDTGLALIKMRQEEAASKDFNTSLGSAFGIKQNPLQQLMSPLPAQTPQSSSEPRGIRNNNPLNLEASPFTQGQPGFVGSDGRFGKFESPEQGFAAADKLLAGYGQRGINSIAGIINRWAPGSDGNNVNAYAAHVAQRVGIDPNQPINLADPTVRAKILPAMAEFENGRPVQVASLDPGIGVSPQTGPQPRGDQVAQANSASPALPGASLAGANLQNAMPVLLQAMTNPRLPASQKALATELFKAALADSKMTDEQKEYTLYRAQGGQLPFFEYKAELKKAGATNVTVNSGEKSYDSKLGSEQASTFVDLQKAGREANGSLSTLRVMEKLIDNPNFYSGTGGQYATQVKRLLVSIGVKEAESAAPNELFQKLSNKIVLDMNGGSLGNQVSNADRSFIENTVANPSNTPEGNRQIIQMAMKIEQRKQEVAKLARDYANKHKGRIDAGFDDELAKWTEANPLFAGGDIGGARQPQQMEMKSQGAPAAMPMPGARQAPDGNWYIQQNGQWFRVEQ